MPDVSEIPAVYSTGQVAKLLGVARSTVTEWFDSGKLRGYRLPGPGHRYRRIPHVHLVTFMRLYGFEDHLPEIGESAMEAGR